MVCAGGRELAESGHEPGLLRTLGVGLAVCGACALVLTAAVVVLRPIQAENRAREREARIHELGVGSLVGEAGEIVVRAVELDTGEYASLDPETLGRAGSVPLAAERDPARIGERPRYAPVWLARRDGALEVVILPVHGRGYVSMIRGYLALAPDGNTVRGLVFTEHEETPGLGAEIQSPQWQSRWHGKRLRDASGEIRIRVVQDAPAVAEHEVHGITGATKTGDGVTAMVRFWVGPDGFGPFLERIAREARP